MHSRAPPVQQVQTAMITHVRSPALRARSSTPVPRYSHQFDVDSLMFPPTAGTASIIKEVCLRAPPFYDLLLRARKCTVNDILCHSCHLRISSWRTPTGSSRRYWNACVSFWPYSTLMARYFLSIPRCTLFWAIL